MEIHNRKLSAFILGALLCTGFAQAQTDEWNDVKTLPAGSKIAIRAQRGKVCVFDSADDKTLACHKHSHQVFYDRRDIREIRVVRKNHWSGGAKFGAMAGATLSVVPFADSSTSSWAIVSVLGGAAIGALAGYEFTKGRGSVIYRRN